MPVVFMNQQAIPDCVCRIECWHGDRCMTPNQDPNPSCLYKIEYEVIEDVIERSKEENTVPVERTANEETGDNKC